MLVAGLHALVEKLRSGGYALREDEPLAGYNRIYVDDPFGNRIELMEPVSGDWKRHAGGGMRMGVCEINGRGVCA